jgi:hypothetical protein
MAEICCIEVAEEAEGAQSEGESVQECQRDLEQPVIHGNQQYEVFQIGFLCVEHGMAWLH